MENQNEAFLNDGDWPKEKFHPLSVPLKTPSRSPLSSITRHITIGKGLDPPPFSRQPKTPSPKRGAKMGRLFTVVKTIFIFILGTFVLLGPVPIPVSKAYAQTGTLHVVITPQDAIYEGAQWNVDGGDWQLSGNTLVDVTIGEHMVNFKNIFGWAAPQPEAVTIAESETKEVTGAYAKQACSVKVNLTPQEAVEQGAQWNVDGGLWMDSGTTVSTLSQGEHSVNFKPTFGYNAPASVTVTLTKDKTAEITGSYVPISGRILRVSIEHQTIQGAIDAAVDGDMVLIADGTYRDSGNKNLDFHGKAIKVTSHNGMDKAIIDCEGEGRGFYFHSGERQDSVISGLTVKNGFVTNYGGGIYCGNSSPTIMDSTITGNRVEGDIVFGYVEGGGGGICCFSSSPIIANSKIADNTVRSVNAGMGGGFYCDDSSRPTISNCEINRNSSTAYWSGCGGGVYGSPVITNCRIAENEAAKNAMGGGNGGGVAGSPLIIDSVIEGNIVGYQCRHEGLGGGVCGSPTLINCIISNNVASNGFKASHGPGGGIFGSPIVMNCVVTGNRGRPDSGISFSLDSISGAVKDSIIYSNDSVDSWGNEYPEISSYNHLYITNSVINGLVNCDVSAKVEITNCTIARVQGSNSEAVTVTNSIVYEGMSEGRDWIVTYSNIKGGHPGQGNIDAEPRFIGNGDYHLKTSSPCIDTGTSETAPATDKDGTSRPQGNGYDMGAYELMPRPVCPGCTGDPALVKNVRYATGTECQCTATTQIVIGPDVTIERGAIVTFQAPKIEVKPGVEIQPGAIVDMWQK